MSSEGSTPDHSPLLSPRGSGNAASAASETTEESYEEMTLKLSNLKRLKTNGQIQELQTIIRDKDTSRSDFIFYANRLIRLVVEEGLNCMPAHVNIVTTPTGQSYEGTKFDKMNCAVSIIRSGEAMERGVRECCRSMRIGKILIRRDPETKAARVYYAKFPPLIEKRTILLLYPVLETGATVQAAIGVLKEHGVQEKNIIFVNLFSTYKGACQLLTKFPDVTLLTSELNCLSPSFFGQKYFGSD